MKKLLITILAVLPLVVNTVFATDTLHLLRPISLENIGQEFAPGYLLVDKKVFKIPYAIDNGFFNGLLYPHTKFNQVYFRNSVFEVFGSSTAKSIKNQNTGFYILDSCSISVLPIFNTSGNVNIFSSKLTNLSVNNTSNLSLRLFSDSSISFIAMQNNKNLNLQLMECAFKDSAEIRIFNSTISQFEFEYDRRSGCKILFQNDTINNFFADITHDSEKNTENYKHENVFTFSNCHINASFMFFERIPNSTLIFNNCTFGPDVYLADMAIDKLVFKNCQKITEQFVIGFREKTNQVKLEMINSNLDNIKFDFISNIKLDFDSIYSNDAIANSYKNLLEKFEHEGKDYSFKIVDLQYRRFKDSRLFHFLNFIWWNHGYSPSLVFFWTFGFLFIFFSFNFKYWKQIFDAYPLKEEQQASIYNLSNKKPRFYSIVFLYTLFIFFSLRVDLNKLNFKNLKFVYAFLAQYLIGLWCMIFIIRFIIKL